MVYKITILYPNKPDVEFKKDYYIQTHMPLVSRLWTPEGLKAWEVVEFDVDESAPYVIGATLTWQDKAACDAAFAGGNAGAVLGDIPNFCNHAPVRIAGNILAAS